MTRKRRAAFTEDYRREAVKRAEMPGNTNASVAKELGVSAQQIYRNSGSE
jgi:transposase